MKIVDFCILNVKRSCVWKLLGFIRFVLRSVIWFNYDWYYLKKEECFEIGFFIDNLDLE